jgi:purine-nucleoside phosphorylase
MVGKICMVGLMGAAKNKLQILDLVMASIVIFMMNVKAFLNLPMMGFPHFQVEPDSTPLEIMAA